MSFTMDRQQGGAGGLFGTYGPSDPSMNVPGKE